MFANIIRYYKSHRTLFSTFALRLAEECRNEGHYSRSDNYLTAIRSFTSAVGEMPIGKVTVETIGSYQQWMKNHDISVNTMSCYNRSLRAIYNKAVSRGLTNDYQPFKDCYKGRARTVKRSINGESIRKLRLTNLHGHEDLVLVRDIFLFSFYAMGMPFVDIAYLKKTQIIDDVLTYYRHKTRQLVKVPLCREALHIINIYSHKRSSYVFPILSSITEPAAYREYSAKLNWYNRALKRLAKVTELDCTLSSYTMRHSWASLAYKSGVSLPVISQALGHSRPDTTMVYIRSIDDTLLRQGNNMVMETII